MHLKYLQVVIISLFFGFSSPISAQRDVSGANFYSQDNTNRTAAEWEPAIGTMVAWPLAVPYKLVVELAKDNHLFTLVENDSTKADAQRWYTKWGIDPLRNTFIIAPQGIDAWWTRDWGPSAVFVPDGTMYLGDGKYIYATPDSGLECSDTLMFIYRDKNNNIIKTEIDDNATVPVGKRLKIPVLELPFITTGGNVLTDGLGSAFSSCILLNENKFFNVPEAQFYKLNEKLLGFKKYHILSNFEKFGIQHLDCFMKLLDEERILVAEPPKDHELYPIYENIVENELKKLTSFYGRPYKILRLKIDRYEGDHLAAYTNSIIVNKTIYVPLFQIKTDSAALQTWQEAMPGYTVKGFTYALKDEPFLDKNTKNKYSSGYGWNHGDALHCRTRAVWDRDMLFISTKRIEKPKDSNQKNIVYTTIIDYSKKGILKDKTLLYWRISGENNWRSVVLNATENPTHFYGEIPFNNKGYTIEYYISAESKSVRKETQPRTAPLGFYTLKL